MFLVGSLERLLYLADRFPLITGVGYIPETRAGMVMEFHHTHFAYPTREDAYILKGVSFKIKPGDITAIVGPSSSGKSTIASLILRLYKPTYGSITICEDNINSVDPSWYKGLIGVLSPDTAHVFSTTISANIAYGVANATLELVAEAAQRANLHSFILSLPNNYQTAVGEGGVQLSPSQCQKLALARLLLRQPYIVILDEPTKWLDEKTETEMITTLLSFLKGRSALLLTKHLRIAELFNPKNIYIMRNKTLAPINKNLRK